MQRKLIVQRYWTIVLKQENIWCLSYDMTEIAIKVDITRVSTVSSNLIQLFIFGYYEK